MVAVMVMVMVMVWLWAWAWASHGHGHGYDHGYDYGYGYGVLMVMVIVMVVVMVWLWLWLWYGVVMVTVMVMADGYGMVMIMVMVMVIVMVMVMIMVMVMVMVTVMVIVTKDVIMVMVTIYGYGYGTSMVTMDGVMDGRVAGGYRTMDGASGGSHLCCLWGVCAQHDVGTFVRDAQRRRRVDHLQGAHQEPHGVLEARDDAVVFVPVVCLLEDLLPGENDALVELVLLHHGHHLPLDLLPRLRVHYLVEPPVTHQAGTNHSTS